MTKESEPYYPKKLCYYCHRPVEDDNHTYFPIITIERNPDGSRYIEKTPVHRRCIPC